MDTRTSSRELESAPGGGCKGSSQMMGEGQIASDDGVENGEGVGGTATRCSEQVQFPAHVISPVYLHRPNR